MHPEFEPLITSWEVALDADGYPATTRRAYLIGLQRFGGWLHQQHPDLTLDEVDRRHVRAWISEVRDTYSANSIRAWLSGVRSFSRWLVDEGETTVDFTDGVRGPRPGDTRTEVLSEDQVGALLATCAGSSFRDRRDAAIIYVFFDGGLRLSEHAQLRVEDFDLKDRVLFLQGKGSNRSGPRRRAVALGVKAARALDRYLRERRKHPFQGLPQMWLGDRSRGPIGKEAIVAILQRRAAAAGIEGFHPHMARHTWASEFRKAGGEEGDLMVLGGWRSRQMLDRYGKVAAEDRAQSSYRQRSFGDRI